MNRRGMVTILAILLLVANAAWCGDLRVSGPVSGTWTSGTSIIIEGPATVVAGASLTIEPGVVITVQVVEPFIIEGSFVALGSHLAPIIIRPTVPWSGFSFVAAGSDVRTLQYVLLDPSMAVPVHLVMGLNSMIEISQCDFVAMRSCVELTGGRAWLKNNKFATWGIFSRTVKLDRLYNDIADACDNHDGNKFCDNIVTALVEDVEGPRPPQSFTTAFYVDGSSNLCLSDNTFTVHAPHTCVGAYFGDAGGFGSGLAIMDHCNVCVRSVDGAPKGVFNANTGSLRVLHCNIDVANDDPESYLYSAGVVASVSADVAVNSSSVVLDRGDHFFVSLVGGLLTYDYNTRWSNSGSAGPNGIPGGPGEDVIDVETDSPNLIDGGHNIDADPLWSREGVWGLWSSEADVRLYYSLLPGSPCIDAADTLYGRDPDDSAPDIGRYPYEGTFASEGPAPLLLPTDLTVGAAYPNPFNLSTTVPFTLARESVVHVQILDVLGREVHSSSMGRLIAGNHELRWDASGLGSGTYFVRMATSSLSASAQRIYLVK